MKKLIVILVVLLAAACEKPACYVCEWTKGAPGTIEYCDKTQEEITAVESSMKITLSTGEVIPYKCRKQ